MKYDSSEFLGCTEKEESWEGFFEGGAGGGGGGMRRLKGLAHEVSAKHIFCQGAVFKIDSSYNYKQRHRNMI